MKKSWAALSFLMLAIAAPALADDDHRETFTVASANVAGSDQSGKFVAGYTSKVYGGDYIFAQACSGGTIALQVLGPDKTTFQTIVSKTTADTTGGTGIALGNGAVVQVVLTGTTSCNANLTRVP